MLVLASPSLVVLFLYLSFRIRQRQKRIQDLAPAHLVSKLTVRRFQGEKDQAAGEECVICLEEYMPDDELRVLPCQHTFHTTCVDAWLTTQKKFVRERPSMLAFYLLIYLFIVLNGIDSLLQCPVCKRDITLESTSSPTLLPLFTTATDAPYHLTPLSATQNV